MSKAIIIGGGSSIRQNQWNSPIDDLRLWNELMPFFTIGTNWSYKWFVPTVHMYSDYQFYENERDNMKHLPLVLGKKDGAYNRRENTVKLDDNTILLKECLGQRKIKYNELHEGMHPHYWSTEAWTKGWYTSQLVGIKAINLAIALNFKEIYLLGFDATDINNHTHFYDDTDVGSYVYNNHKHTGIGKDDRGLYRTGNYNKIDELNNFWLEPFKAELNKGINIFNVSINSKIDVFPKMTYKRFFNRLQLANIPCNHDEMRNMLKEKLDEKMQNCNKSIL